MTREEAHNLTERLADAVARYAKSQHGQAQTDYQAQADAYNAQNEIIAALLSNNQITPGSEKYWADQSYKFADAMLQSRQEWLDLDRGCA